MKILYINNFRGFDSTFLPFEEVNFFVGENSTGKTSILKLIGILSSPGFWNYQQFNSEEISLGSFSEIISSNAEKDFFEIGIFEDEGNGNVMSAIKLTFIEKDNFPHIKEICFVNNEINIQTTIEGKLLKYRFSLVNEPTSIIHEKNWFNKWVKNSGLNDKKFSRREMEFLGIKSILFQLQAFINNDLKQEIKFKIGTPSFITDIAWTAPARKPPQKTYDSYTPYFTSDGSHAPYILKDIIGYEEVKTILNKFGQDSGLYDDIEINVLGEQNKQTDPFEVLIILNGKKVNFFNVGYGVSQVLPLLIEVIGRPNESWFAIQQPEVHLHPRAQAAFGDFIYKSNTVDRQKFIIETHSDYTIDRYRLKLNKDFREKKSTNNKGQVVFFRRHEKGNEIQIMSINKDGAYPDNQPEDFRDFFIKEQLDLISI